MRSRASSAAHTAAASVIPGGVVPHAAALERRGVPGAGEQVGQARAGPERGDVVGRPVGLGSGHSVSGDQVRTPGVGCVRRRCRSRVAADATRQGARWSGKRLRRRAIRRRCHDPSAVPRSSTMLRLDRLSISKGGLAATPRSGSRPSIRPNVRAGSPDGGSILTTSAPQSARIAPAAGAATHTPSSMTSKPLQRTRHRRSFPKTLYNLPRICKLGECSAPARRLVPVAGLAGHIGHGVQRIATDAVIGRMRALPRRIADLDPGIPVGTDRTQGRTRCRSSAATRVRRRAPGWHWPVPGCPNRCS